jgi:signal transduction histidine kinase
VSVGFDRARLYRFDDAAAAFVGVDSLGEPSIPGFCGHVVRVVDNAYAGETISIAETDPRALVFDPRSHSNGIDAHCQFLRKSADLPWASVPLFIAGRVFGKIVADNQRTGRDMTQVSLDYLSTLGTVGGLFAALQRTLKEELYARAAQGRAEGSKLVSDHVARFMGHELRNVSVNLMARIELMTTLAPSSWSPVVIRERLAGITRLVKAMNQSVSALLDLSGEKAYSLQGVDAVDLLRVALDTSAAYMEIDGVNVKVGGCEQLYIQVVPQAFVIAIVHLFRNAIDSMAGIGRRKLIKVTLRNASGVPQLIVEDNGAGFTADAKRRCFDAGFTTKAQHSGMGLTKVSEILNDVGGRVTIGKQPRVGARLVIRLPNVGGGAVA